MHLWVTRSSSHFLPILRTWLYRRTGAAPVWIEAERSSRQFINRCGPYGGVACFELGDIENQDLEQWASTLSRSSLQRDGQLAVLSRVGALEGAGTWSDEYGSPANTLMSSESRVKAPLGVLWFGGPASDPSLFYDRHQWASSAIIVSGRMIIQGPQKLTAVDVYTGRILWQIPLKKGLSPGRRAAWESTGFHFLATDDRIYLVYEKACQVFDAASGERINVFKLEDPNHSFGRIRIWENWLIVPAFTSIQNSGRFHPNIIAMDRYDGETVWNIKTVLSLNPNRRLPALSAILIGIAVSGSTGFPSTSGVNA